MNIACLQADSGLIFTIGINVGRNLIYLKAQDSVRAIDVTFESEDGIDNLYYVNAVWGPYNPIKGKKLFFHKGTNLYKSQNGSIELRSCPIDAQTSEPVAALVVHYRFDIVPGMDALRISSWFTKPEPITAETLNWLNLVPVQSDFNTLVGYDPSYQCKLNAVPHPIRFPVLGINSNKGWAVLTDCGEAMFSPSDSSSSAMHNQIPGYFKPHATTINQINLTLYNKSNPLTATLVVGTGEIYKPKLPVQKLNISDEEKSCNFDVPWKEYGTDFNSIVKVDGEGILESTSMEGLHALLPPRSCLILKNN